MPQHKSAKKRVKQNNKKRLINKSISSKFKSTISDFQKSLEKKDKKSSETLLSLADSAISKAVSRGIIKKRAASRKISKLAKLIK